MKQLGEEILKFEEPVQSTAAGKAAQSSRVEPVRFHRLKSDMCVYVYKDDLGREMYFLSYVDDIIFASTNEQLRDRFFQHLGKTWQITREGTLDRFLAINFSRSADGWTWSASLKGYVDKIVARFNLQDAKPVKTPLEPGFLITEADFNVEATEDMKSELRSLIGSIGYATLALRYDVAYAVSVLSRYLVRPCRKIIEAARRLIVYLNSTRDFSITWTSSPAGNLSALIAR